MILVVGLDPIGYKFERLLTARMVLSVGVPA